MLANLCRPIQCSLLMMLLGCAPPERTVTPIDQPEQVVASTDQPDLEIRPAALHNKIEDVWNRPDGWEYAANTDDAIVFIHRSSIRRSEGFVEAWFMTNHVVPLQDTSNANEYYSSSKSLMSYDCDNRRTRLISGTNYSRLSGGGETLDTCCISPIDSRPIAPGTVGEAQMKAACAR